MEEKKLLQITLAHEFRRCSKSFNEFAKAIAILPDNNTKENRVECYNLYADFTKFLYEFYKGLIEHHYPGLKDSFLHKLYPDCLGKKNYEKLDTIVTEEVRKLYGNRKDRILRGERDSLGHNIQYYECEVPEEFGEHFRYIRNRNSHTLIGRASSSATITLSNFYKKYHKFIIILYYEAKNLWVTNSEEFDFREIEDFANSVLATIDSAITQNSFNN